MENINYIKVDPLCLDNTLPDILDDSHLNIRQTLCFLHDGYTVRFNINVRYFFDTAYEDKWIGRVGPFACQQGPLT